MSNSSSAPGTASASGIVVSTMGTAPRRPAHETNTCCRAVSRWAGKHASTESGRATKVSSRPASAATATWVSEMRPGDTSSPSITNRPIWASQATPSLKERVAARCGSSLLPSTRAPA